MTTYSLTRISHNAKTGPIPVVTASKDTCPSSCSLKGAGCYAETGPLALHWARVDKSGLSFSELATRIKALPRRTLWRYGQAGDLPNSEAEIRQLAVASAKTKPIIYTHKHDPKTLLVLKELAPSFNVNLSADNLDQADELAATGLPVVVVLSKTYQKATDETLRQFRDRVGGLTLKTKAGHPVAICPATYLDTNCATCQVCASPRTGGTIIGFPAHGTRKRAVSERVGVGGVPITWTKTNRKSLQTSVT